MPRVSLRGGDRVNGLEKSRRLVNPFIYASLFSAEHVHYETASPISLSLSLSLSLQLFETRFREKAFSGEIH
jgi:hypothetical protein